MANKPKKYTTVRVPFQYPALGEPDYGTKDYPTPDGNYKVNARVQIGSEAFDSLVAMVEPLHNAAVTAAEEAFAELTAPNRKKLEKKNGGNGLDINPFYTEELDRESGEETGYAIFKFKAKAGGTIKSGPKKGQEWSRKLPVFDAKGRRMLQVPQIWSGSEGKISFTGMPYFVDGTGLTGLRLSLEAVQVIEIVEGGAASAEGYGFGEEEGYEHDETTAKSSDDVNDDSDGDDGETDF